MLDYLRGLFGGGLIPHVYCLAGRPELIWTHVVSDALIGIAYFSIPIAIASFLTRRRDMVFSSLIWLFAAFIMCCGLTHFMSIWTLWHPDYGAEALLKALTAIVSVLTAVAMWPLIPRALALPSPAQLQAANAELTAALEALNREQADRERAEAMLRQSQKMQAIGQLTGGIAHDFNNLLMVVTGNLDRACRLAPDVPPEAGRALGRAREGADRAAALTQQLLAFARRAPQVEERHDLNALALATLDLVRPTLRGVAFDCEFAPDLWPVRVDPDQTQNAILNLLVNARDAMPEGGRITLATRNREDTSALPDGGREGVELIVRDTGTGMDEATRAQAFEPFFTTKAVGKGTGMGLAQVYGFVNQSRGNVGLTSAPGQGTTIIITLPRAAV